ncbi:protein translocase subunit SecF [Williamsia sterculiae]|uniref:Protein-export membrane protein SecF n=1 Tax=Williamsia sterculiae TaxID=1344003 RepID=A0A1N7EGW2_9NOCA|nr:protein translocase subunit SecF [Williamsia sterculiae]SIR87316.1 preprotein translocase subunit SecF [Williamsia sterculiae]
MSRPVDTGSAETGAAGAADTDDRLPAGSDADYVPAKDHSLLSRLYTGTGAFEIIARRRMWYGITAAILAICVLSIAIRGFTFGIDFEGGTQVSFPATAETSTSAVEKAYRDTLGTDPTTVQTAGSGSSKTVQIRTETLSQQDTQKLTQKFATTFGPEVTADKVSSSDVSSSWGSEITKKAIIALAVFLAIILVYITIRFDREMAFAALASLFFDVLCTAGIYSLVGFEVTPATVIGLLTILGFSIYDTVVVFDKVNENTRSFLHTTRRTYAEQANLAVNQTLMRSINTTVISALPILALIVIAVWLLGVGTLKDLALIQLVGVVVGAYSSVFFASPLLVTLKERRSEIARHTRKVLDRRIRQEGGVVPTTDDDETAARRPQGAAARRRNHRVATGDDAGRGGTPSRPSGKRRTR